MTTPRTTRRTLLGAMLAAPFATPALAAPWRADRPVELVVGFAAGGGTDIVARLFAKQLEPLLGQPVTVVNRPGASSEVALAYVSRAKPDGHVLGLTNMPSFVTVPVERRSQYNLDSFAFLGNIMTDPTGMIVRGDSTIRSIPQLIQQAKADPEGIVASTSGIGTDDHLLLVMLQELTGARFTIAHYNGAPQQRNALLAGQVQVNLASVGEIMPNPDGIRFIGHAGEERSRFAADVPTFREAGFNLLMHSERGLVVPAGTPAPILARLREAVEQAAADQATVRSFATQFIAPNYEPGPVWEARMRSTQGSYAELWRKTPWIA